MNTIRLLFVATVLVALSSFSFAQVAGDYGSAAVGPANWSTPGSWLVFVVASDWSDATVAVAAPTSATNVFVRTGNTIDLDGAGLTCNNLSVTGTLEFNSTVAVNFTVNGNISLLTGGVFKMLANTLGITTPNGVLAHTLNLKGDLTHNGTTLDFRTGSAGTTLSVCNVTFSGTSNSTVNAPYVNSSNGEFNYITINKTSGGKVILGSDIITAGGSGTGPAVGNSGITFTSGIVETGGFKLAYQGSTLAQVAGASSASYVIGNFGRGMSTSGGSNKDFPVGDANGYRPVYVRSTTAGTTVGHLVIVKCVTGDANTGSSTFNSGGIDKVSPVRYYQVTYSNAIAGAASMSFDQFKLAYGADDGVTAASTDLRVAYSTPAEARGNWTGITQTTPHTATITDPPTQITPDVIATTVNTGQTMFLALARNTGSLLPLPVEVTSFTASMQSASSAMLSWSTATEVNNSGFEIERRTEVSSTWAKAGFVSGAGTSNSPKEYSFIDRALASGRYSYRLKQIDNDGSFRYYGTEAIVEVGAAPRILKLDANYPNPFNPTTSINFTIAKDGKAALRVYNVLGEEVAVLFNGDARAGQIYHATFNAGRLPSGLYFARLESGNSQMVQKMLLTK